MNSKELHSWLRPVSRMVQFAKSIRAEVKPDPAASSDPTKDVPDPFAAINLDDLSDDLRKPIEAAKAAFVAQQTLAKDAETKRGETEKFARDQQARADKAQQILAKHNLTDSGAPVVDPDDIKQNPVYVEMEKQLLADGVKPELATSYAKMFAVANKATRAQIMEELTTTFGPLVGSVNDVQADRVLRAAIEEDATGVFEIAEVQKEVRENVELFVKNGRVLDAATVKNLASMAFGNYAQKQLAEGKPIVKSTQPIPTPTRGRLPNIGVSHVGNFATTPNQPRGDGEPIPATPETAAAIAATVAHFKKDLKPKK